MKILLKIIAIPFIIVLSITVAFLYFIFCISEWICTVAAVIISGAGIVMLATGYSVYSSIGLIVIGFLVSPSVSGLSSSGSSTSWRISITL